MDNLEEIYTILYGASNSCGVKYDVVKKWFIECKIIDDRSIVEEFFTKSYERLSPDREELTLTQFIQLIGILARETKQDIRCFADKFDTVKSDILQEIQERIREETHVPNV